VTDFDCLVAHRRHGLPEPREVREPGLLRPHSGEREGHACL
jgi:hypothetical protein